MKKLMSIVLTLIVITSNVCVYASHVTNQNDDVYYEELVASFSKQTSSERDPLRMCFPTSMINAGLCCKVQFPSRNSSKYSQLEDIYDEYIYSNEMKYWLQNHAPQYINKYISWGCEPRELWEVEVAAFNSFVGYDACKLNINIGKYELLDILDKEGAIVMSGVFCGLNHCVCVIGYEVDSKDSDKITNIIFNDPFGDPYKNYRNPGVGGDVVKMPIREFWDKTQKNTDGQHVGIIFKCNTDKCAEYNTDIPAIYSDIETYYSKKYALELTENAKNASSIYSKEKSCKYKPTFISSEPSKTQYASPSTWYSIYVDYQMNYGFDNTKTVISYFDYLALANMWSELIPKHFLFPMINESLKQDVSINQIYAIAKVETLNFRYFESITKNSNGTVDYGIMGLNSKNFDEQTWDGRKFLNEHFFYDDEYESFNPDNQLHMLKICVHYLKYLIDYAGSFSEAAICYNGGPTAWSKKKSSSKAIEYSNTVVTIANKFDSYTSKFNIPIGMISLYITTPPSEVLKSIKNDSIEHIRRSLREQPLFIAISDPFYDLLDAKKYAIFPKDDRDSDDDEVEENEGTFIGTISKSGNYIILS